MEQLDWSSFIGRAAGTRPESPDRWRQRTKRRAEAQEKWDAWHQYIADIVRLARDPGTEALVLFENVQMDSSQFGRQTVMCVGPERTYKSVAEIEGRWLGDLPSERQYPGFWTDTRDKAALVDAFEVLMASLLQNASGLAR